MSCGDVTDLLEVSQGVLWSTFTVDRGMGPGFVVLEGRLLDGLIERLFGAMGEDEGGGLRAPHPLTDVEVRVGTRILDELSAAITLNWPARPTPNLLDRLTSAPRPNLPPPAALMVTVSIECGPVENPLGRITLALPAAMLRGVQVSAASSAATPPARTSNYERLLPLNVELIVELAHVPTTLRALQDLKVGDVIPLGPVQPVRAFANGRLSFLGEAGTEGDRRSLRIARRAGHEGGLAPA
jgi:flagellar motor switch protein FliM